MYRLFFDTSSTAIRPCPALHCDIIKRVLFDVKQNQTAWNEILTNLTKFTAATREQKMHSCVKDCYCRTPPLDKLQKLASPGSVASIFLSMFARTVDRDCSPFHNRTCSIHRLMLCDPRFAGERHPPSVSKPPGSNTFSRTWAKETRAWEPSDPGLSKAINCKMRHWSKRLLFCLFANLKTLFQSLAANIIKVVMPGKSISTEQWSTNLSCDGPDYPFSRNWRPMLISEDPISNLCCIQLPVTQHCYVNVINREMTKTVLHERQTINVPLLLQQPMFQPTHLAQDCSCSYKPRGPMKVLKRTQLEPRPQSADH